MSQQKEKSNAPWILGIIGLFLTILHFACAFLCSAGLAATKVATEGEAAGESVSADDGGDVGGAFAVSWDEYHGEFGVFGACGGEGVAHEVLFAGVGAAGGEDELMVGSEGLGELW